MYSNSTATPTPTPSRGWWTAVNRAGFCLGAIVAMISTVPTPASAAGGLPITQLDWRVVNDTVMGGVSQSRVEATDTVTFSGELSLERNGGFASMRASVPEGALVDGTALRLVLRGDGRTYDLTLRRADVPLRAGSYRVPVVTEVGRSTVEVPLSAFRPSSFGRPVMGAPALDARLDRVDTIGVMLADKQPGAFALEILEVTVVAGDNPTALEPRGPVLDSLRAAIELGVRLFNNGDHGACRDTYAAVLNAALGRGALTHGERSLIEESLAKAASQQSEEAAWTLRHAIDSVLRAGA